MSTVVSGLPPIWAQNATNIKIARAMRAASMPGPRNESRSMHTTHPMQPMTSAPDTDPSPTESAGPRGTFHVQLSVIESAAEKLRQSALSTVDAMREVMVMVKFCCNVQKTSVTMSLLANDLPQAPTVYGPMASELHHDATVAMAASHRIGRHVKAAMTHIEGTADLLAAIASGLESSSGSEPDVMQAGTVVHTTVRAAPRVD